MFKPAMTGKYMHGQMAKGSVVHACYHQERDDRGTKWTKLTPICFSMKNRMKYITWPDETDQPVTCKKCLTRLAAQAQKAENAAKAICHDLHEGSVPGCDGKRLSLPDMPAAREYIAEIVGQYQ